MEVIIGYASGYDFDQIEPWVVSIQRTGFEGKIVVVAGRMSRVCIKTLEKLGVLVVVQYKDENENSYSNSSNIMVDRFELINMWLHRNRESITQVYITDVRDVVFQKRPVHKFMPWEIVVAGENFLYKDEPWSKRNMIESFGEQIYDRMKDHEILCAGVIAGGIDAIIDLTLQIVLVCGSAPSQLKYGGGPDQAAMNIILRSSITRTPTTHYCLILHAGTTLPAIMNGFGDVGLQYQRDPSSVGSLFINPYESPYITDDGLVRNQDGYIYTIVHQYNRIKEWNEAIDKKYRN